MSTDHTQRHDLPTRIAAILIPLVGIVTGCGIGSNGVDGASDAQARWNEADVASYQFEIEQLCFCAPEAIGPFEVTVRGGQVVEATYEEGPLSDRAPEHLFTVEQLFAQIDAWRDYDEITASFDPDFGFPVEVYADQDGDVEDDHKLVTVTNFVVLDG